MSTRSEPESLVGLVQAAIEAIHAVRDMRREDGLAELAAVETDAVLADLRAWLHRRPAA